MKKYSSLFIILTIVSVVNLLVSNVIAIKQFQVGILTLPCAMLIFPITYIISDVISEVYGYRASRINSWYGFFANVFMVVIFQLTILLPYPNYFENQEAIQIVLGNTPRILFASLFSYMMGDFFNDKTFRKMRGETSDLKGFKKRAIVSSMVGEFFDAGLFIPLAFYGTMPNRGLAVMFLSQWVVKILYEIIILPITNIVVLKVKEYEEA